MPVRKKTLSLKDASMEAVVVALQECSHFGNPFLNIENLRELRCVKYTYRAISNFPHRYWFLSFFKQQSAYLKKHFR